MDKLTWALIGSMVCADIVLARTYGFSVDGVSDADELTGLAALDITSISVDQRRLRCMA